MLVETEGLKQKRNEVSAEIANAKRNKQDATDAIKEMREVGAKIKSLDEELEEVEATVKDMASRLPNLRIRRFRSARMKVPTLNCAK